MKDYKKILEGVVDIINNTEKSDIGFANICTYIGENCPELKESEDERIRKDLIIYLRSILSNKKYGDKFIEGWIAWLEKQGNTNETIKRNEFAQGVLKGAAINLITWIDYNAAEGNMCLSNMECEDIEDALVSGDWDKIYAYIKKKLEKNGEQKSAEFKPSFRVGDVIKPKDPVLGEPRIIKGIHPKFGYDTNNGILDFEFEDNWELVEQKPAWSEEDKEMLEDTCRILSNSKECTTSNVRWLKSLRPQSHWKPSDEQIKAIKWVMDGDSPENWSITLKNLYQDLKKLKG